jgi:hypothetical protein
VRLPCIHSALQDAREDPALHVIPLRSPFAVVLSQPSAAAADAADVHSFLAQRTSSSPTVVLIVPDAPGQDTNQQGAESSRLVERYQEPQNCGSGVGGGAVGQKGPSVVMGRDDCVHGWGLASPPCSSSSSFTRAGQQMAAPAPRMPQQQHFTACLPVLLF